MQANKFNNRTQAMNAEKAVVDQAARRRAESLQAAQQAREALTRSLQQRVDKQEAQTAVINRETGGDSIAFNVPNKFLLSTSDGTMKKTTRAGESEGSGSATVSIREIVDEINNTLDASEGSGSVTVSIREIVDEINNTLDANETIREINRLRPHEPISAYQPISDQQEAVIRNMTVDQRDEFMGYFEPNASRAGAFNLSVYKTTGQILDQNVKRLDWQQKNGISTAENSAGWTMESELDFMDKAPDGAIITQDSAINGSSDLSSTFGSPLNGTQGTQVTLSELSQVSGNTSITAKIVNNEIVFSAPPDSTGKATFAYTIEDANGKLSTSYVDVEVSEYTTGELLERDFAAERLAAVSDTTYEDLTITENDDGTFTFKAKVEDQSIDFTLAAGALKVPPTFIEEVLSESAFVGAMQASKQYNGEAQYFDLNDVEQKDAYHMFLRVGALVGVHKDRSGGTLFFDDSAAGTESLLISDRVYDELAGFLFDTPNGNPWGKTWFSENFDGIVGSLSNTSSSDGFTGNSAEEVLDQLNDFLGASNTTMLTKSDGTTLTVEEKDLVMSVLQNQVGFLTSHMNPELHMDALKGSLDLLGTYASVIYAPDTLQAYKNNSLSLDYEINFSEMFNDLSGDELTEALNSGNLNDFGLTDEEFFLSAGDFLYAAAKIGLEIRFGLEIADKSKGMWTDFGAMFKGASEIPTDEKIKQYIGAVIQDMRDTANSSTINDMMAQFHASMNRVSDTDEFAAFKNASNSIKSYSQTVTGNGTGGLASVYKNAPMSVPAAGFLTILALGTAGQGANGAFTSDQLSERLAAAGWATLIATGANSTVDSLLGGVTTDLIDANPKLQAFDNLVRDARNIQVNNVDGVTTFTGTTRVDIDADVKNVGDLMKRPAVQSIRSARGVLQTLGAIAAPAGTGLISAAGFLQASQETETNMKIALNTVASGWGIASGGYAVSGSVGILKSLGVDVGQAGLKLAKAMGSLANFAARATALGFGIIGAIEGRNAQQDFIDLWNILSEPGGDTHEDGYFVKEQFRDLEPLSVSEAGFIGFMLGMLGGEVVVGFEYHPALDNGSSEYSDFDPSGSFPTFSRTTPQPEPELFASYTYAGESLSPDQSLERGEFLQSSNGRYQLVLQRDGNLVLRDNYSITKWSANTSSGEKLLLQLDGNLVLLDGNDKVVWESRTSEKGSDQLLMQSDGNLVLKSEGRPVWDTLKWWQRPT